MSTQIETYPPSLFRPFSKTPGPVVIIFGTLELDGWPIKIIRIKRILPGKLALDHTMALAFILGGEAAWLAREETIPRRLAYAPQNLHDVR
ncbi:MAG: hypothetical protein ACYDBV_09695 [Nitrospiria bacterium]